MRDWVRVIATQKIDCSVPAVTSTDRLRLPARLASQPSHTEAVFSGCRPHAPTSDSRPHETPTSALLFRQTAGAPLTGIDGPRATANLGRIGPPGTVRRMAPGTRTGG